MKLSSFFTTLTYLAYSLSIYYTYTESFGTVSPTIMVTISLLALLGIVTFIYNILHKNIDIYLIMLYTATIISYFYFIIDYWILKKLWL